MNKFLALLFVGISTMYAQQESRPASPTNDAQTESFSVNFAALAQALQPEAKKTEEQRRQDWQRQREQERKEYQRLQIEIRQREQELLKAQEELKKQRLLGLRKWVREKAQKARADFKGELENVDTMQTIEE